MKIASGDSSIAKAACLSSSLKQMKPNEGFRLQRRLTTLPSAKLGLIYDDWRSKPDSFCPTRPRSLARR